MKIIDRNTRSIVALVSILTMLLVMFIGINPFAATSLTPISSAKTGTSLTKSTLTIGTEYQFSNSGKSLLVVENTLTTTATLTIQTGATVGGYSVSDQAITIAPQSEYVIGTFNPGVFNDSSGYVLLSVATTTCTLAVVAVTSN